MKIKCNHFKRVTASAIALALVLAVAISCKKTTDEIPTPVETPPTPPPANLFHSGYHKMITDEEINNQTTYGGSFLYTVGSGLLGEEGPEIPYGEVVKTLWDIYDYQHTETQFEKINTELEGISEQITDLKGEINSLSQQLNLVQSNIINKLNSLFANQLIVDINTAWDSSSPSGLQYYSKTATVIQKGTPGAPTWAELDAHALSFAQANSGTLMQTKINGLQSLLLGSTTGTSFSQSSIKQFADGIILAQQSPIHSPAYAMNCYKVLENYFLITLNAQFRAFTIYSNALYRTETDSVAANYDYHLYLQSFAKILQQELAMFLTVTDYLSVNLLDYRAGGGFSLTTDLRYFNYGLKPDDLFAPVIARANMLNQLVNHALGQPTKDIYVTISVPKNYSNSAQLQWTALNPYPFAIDNNGAMPSQFPYTGWNAPAGQTGTCSPDNSVTFYRSNEGIGGSNHVTMSSIGVQLLDIPWRVRVSLAGSIPIGYYNPKDISAAPQSAWSSTYSLCFGSASVCWYWGYLWLNDNIMNNMLDEPEVLWQFPPVDYLKGFPSPMMYSAGGGGHIPHYGGNFSHGDYTLGYSGTFPTTSGSDYLWIGELRSAPIIVGKNTVQNTPTMAMYLSYEVIPFNWSRSTESYFCGTEMTDENFSGMHGTWTNKSLLDYLSNSSTKYAQSGTATANLSDGNHTFNVGFYVKNPDETGHTNNCEMIWYSQVIYNGTYNIWSK